MSVFLICNASSTVLPFTHSVANEDDAMAEPQPKVLNFASSMTLVSGLTLICSFITSPHSGAPTRPVPTSVLPITGFQRRRLRGVPTADRQGVYTHQERLAFRVVDSDTQVPGQPMLHRPIDITLIAAAHDVVSQPIAQSRKVAAFLRHM